MDQDPGITCFQHCDTKVFCNNLPEKCPACEICLTNNFKILPFSFYENNDDLHIGITTTDGTVIEFDKNGLMTTNTHKWNQSLLLFEAEEPWYEIWQEYLEEIIKENCWTSSQYDEKKNNCYSFVLTFLQRLNYGKLSKYAENNVDFCKNVILPKTIVAGKYTSLYRELKDKKYVLYKVNDKKL